MREAPFIVLEGIDGAGTTTQTARLVTRLRAEGLSAHGTREPSDGPLGMFLRQVLTGRIVLPDTPSTPRWAELGLLFAADRLDHLSAEVLPRVGRGEWVVSDRYDHSTVAYQSALAKDPDAVRWLRELNRFARRPDLTIVLDVSAQVARERRLARAGAREMFDDDELQQRLASFYGEIDRHFAGERIAHVDADGDLESVTEAVWRACAELKGER